MRLELIIFLENEKDISKSEKRSPLKISEPENGFQTVKFKAYGHKG